MSIIFLMCLFLCITFLLFVISTTFAFDVEAQIRLRSIKFIYFIVT